MRELDQKLLQTILQKAEAVCPDSLELIALYGSVATGDLHTKSDLDLLLLVKDEEGRKLADGFLLENIGVGFDLYCTTWQMLESDARCDHPHLSKLLDASVFYVKNPETLQRLEQLQQQARNLLSSEERFARAQNALEQAKKIFADSILNRTLSKVRLSAGGVIYFVLNAVMLFHGKYFRKGTKRTLEEIAALGLPFDLQGKILEVIQGETIEKIQTALTDLLRTVQDYCQRPHPKPAPTKESLAGTYEEMFSNWRNKMEEAIGRKDLFSSFMNLVSFQCMLDEMAENVQISPIDAMAQFDPADPEKNCAAFDTALAAYEEEYEKTGLQPKRFADLDEFIAQYLSEGYFPFYS